VSAGFGCSGARKIMRKCFLLVVETGQTAGGCAQKRSTKGCRIMRYRCFMKYVYAANELNGNCNGPKGVVRFIEVDRGPTDGPHLLMQSTVGYLTVGPEVSANSATSIRDGAGGFESPTSWVRTRPQLRA
jgi:hypothetical protein